MIHNTFNFTVECSSDPSYPGNYYLYDYFVDCAVTENDCFDIEIKKISSAGPGRWIVVFCLTVHDYGVAQVGMHLVGAYIRNVYEPIYAGDTKFVIDECEFYHPSGKGARIDWDEDTDSPIVEELTKEADLSMDD